MATINHKKTTPGVQSAKKTPEKAGATADTNGAYSYDTNKQWASKQTGHKESLDHLFESCLQHMYSAEKQLVEAIPAMVKAADNEDLQNVFEDHLQQTKKHVERLEKIFNRLQITPGNDTCKLMEGLIAEAKKTVDEYQEGPVRDSALIIGAQKIEHHEIAAYGSLCELADVLGHHKIMDILDRTLSEAENGDRLLTRIAERINDEAYEMAEYAHNEE